MMPTMTLAVEVDPAQAGFDAQRLQRIDRHFGAYLDDGRLPGWLAVVARDGQIVHVGRGGMRDLARGRPVSLQRLRYRVALESRGSARSFFCATATSSTSLFGLRMTRLSSARRSAYFAISLRRFLFWTAFETLAIGAEG